MVDRNDDEFFNILSIVIAFLLPDSISCFRFILSNDRNANSVFKGGNGSSELKAPGVMWHREKVVKPGPHLYPLSA